MFKQMLVVALLSVTTLEIYGMPTIKAPTSPAPDATVTAIVPGQSPADVVGFFAPDLSDLMPASFLLTNNTDRPILAILVVWTTVDANGMRRDGRFSCDGYLGTSGLPVVAPHSSIVVAPGLWVPQARIAQYRASANVTQLRHMADKFRMAAALEIRVDSIIYSDGTVFGPDTYGFADEIAARKLAANQILDLVATARSRGQAPSDRLKDVVKAAVARGQHVDVWRRRFAQQVLHSPNQAATLDYLVRLPEVPEFKHIK